MKAYTVVMRSEHGKLMFTILARGIEHARSLMRQPTYEQMGLYPSDWYARFHTVTIEEAPT